MIIQGLALIRGMRLIEALRYLCQIKSQTVVFIRRGADIRRDICFDKRGPIFGGLFEGHACFQASAVFTKLI